MNDETKLPKWAQKKLEGLRFDIRCLWSEMEDLRAAHAVLTGRNWTTIPGPSFREGDKVRYLWGLDHERPFSICSLGPGDVLLVGRSIVRVWEPGSKQDYPHLALALDAGTPAGQGDR